MGLSWGKASVAAAVRAVWPALAVLVFTFVIAVFFTEFTFVSGAKAAWLVFLRFFRISLILLLPVLCLPWIFSLASRFFRKGSLELVQFQQERNQEITPLKNWLLRPFQGIGLCMLLATKLIFLLELYSGATIDASAMMHPASFSPWRFLATTAMAVTISLLLSCLWTLDDLGIRLHNRKTGEVRMIGRYLGVILPVILGFYGMMSLSRNYSLMMAIQYLAQIVLIQYPPFVVFNVFQAHYTGRNESRLLERLQVKSKTAL